MRIFEAASKTFSRGRLASCLHHLRRDFGGGGSNVIACRESRAGRRRGAGRGIAIELGAAGATVYVTGRSTRERRDQGPHFAISETPRFVGRAVAALAGDPDKARWNGRSLSSGGLAQVYGFDDLGGSRPDCWRYMVEVQEAGKPADVTGYR